MVKIKEELIIETKCPFCDNLIIDGEDCECGAKFEGGSYCAYCEEPHYYTKEEDK